MATRDISRKTDPEQERRAGHRLLTEVAPRIDSLRERWEGNDGPGVIETRSSLAGDNAASAPFHVSHTAWEGVATAIDHLAAVRQLVTGTPEAPILSTRPYATYALIRAAFEGASRTQWLLGPKARNERLTRRFRLALADAKNQDRAMKIIDPSRPALYPKRESQVADLASAKGIALKDCKIKVTTSELIRSAAEVVGANTDVAHAYWSVMSGVAHADQWAQLALVDLSDEGSPTDDPDVASALLTSSFSSVWRMTVITLDATAQSLSLYDNRRTCQL